jgi:hypothetical protein
MRAMLFKALALAGSLAIIFLATERGGATPGSRLGASPLSLPTLPTASGAEGPDRKTPTCYNFNSTQSECTVYQDTSSSGGTWSIYLVNPALSATIPYASNSLQPGETNTAVSDANFNWYPAPIPSGYTLDWVAAISPCGVPDFTFGAASLTMTVSSAIFSPSTVYYLYVYEVHSGRLLTSEAAGSAQSGQLSFPSPFENGFIMPRGKGHRVCKGGVFVEIVH